MVVSLVAYFFWPTLYNRCDKISALYTLDSGNITQLRGIIFQC